MDDYLEKLYQGGDAYAAAEAYKPIIDQLLNNPKLGNAGVNATALPAAQAQQAQQVMEPASATLSEPQRRMAFRVPQERSLMDLPASRMIAGGVNKAVDAATGWLNAGTSAEESSRDMRNDRGWRDVLAAQETRATPLQSGRNAGGWRMASDDSVNSNRSSLRSYGATGRMVKGKLEGIGQNIAEWANQGSAAEQNTQDMDADRDWWSFDSKLQKAKERENHLFKLLDEDERASQGIFALDKRHDYGVRKDVYFSTKDTYSAKMADHLSQVLKNEKYGESGLNLANELQDRFVRTGEPIDGMTIWSTLRDHYGNQKAIEIINEMGFFSGAQGIEMPDGRKGVMFGMESEPPYNRRVFR